MKDLNKDGLSLAQDANFESPNMKQANCSNMAFKSEAW
jgi:hypothetical protein